MEFESKTPTGQHKSQNEQFIRRKQDEEEESTDKISSSKTGIQRKPQPADNNQPRAITQSNIRSMAVNQGDASQPLAMNNPALQVQQRLQGKGESMGGETKSRMENALGADLTGVKLHTGGEGNEVAKEHNAKALTVGQDIAFASGEYKPGTMEGDALLLHESHHTLQQKGASNDPETMKKETQPQANENAYEQEADNAAVAGTAKLWGKSDSWIGKMAGKTKNVMKTGLGLQRCGGSSTKNEKNTSTPFISYRPNTDVRYFYIKGESRFNRIKQTFAKSEIQMEGSPTPSNIVKKKHGGVQDQFYLGKVTTTSSTPKPISILLDSLVAAGGELFITNDSFSSKFEEIQSKFRSLHPNSFSLLQIDSVLKQKGVIVSSYSTTEPSCIETMNQCIENIYGSQTLKKGELKSTAFESIEALRQKGKVREKRIVSIEYTGPTKRFSVNAKNIGQRTKFSTLSFSNTLINMVKEEEDGYYVFVCSLLNGYHSILILLSKNKNTHRFVWKDQHANDLTGEQHTEYDAAGLDENLLAYASGRFSWRVRKRYASVYGVQEPNTYASIENDTVKTPKIENLEKPNLVNPDKTGDWQNTIVAQLKP